jgi:hypothetical protein
MYGYGGDYGLKVTRRKLCELEQRGFIRSWQPGKYEQKIYYLTKAGAKEIEYFLNSEPVTTYRKNEKTLHQVLVSEVYVQLRFERTGELSRFLLNKKFGSCIPDAYILYDTKQQGFEFYLEVDRETESVVYIRDTKLDQYRRLFERIGPTARHVSVIILTQSEYRKRALDALKRHFSFPIRIHTFNEFNVEPSIVCKGSAFSESLEAYPIS